MPRKTQTVGGKSCTRCGIWKPLSEYYQVHSGKRTGQFKQPCISCDYFRCRDWRLENLEKHIASQRKTKQSHKEQYSVISKLWHERNKQRVIESVARWHNKNKHRTRLIKVTNTRLRRALADGTVVKGTACETCGCKDGIEAAHWDYSKPLEPKWLCRPCHRKWDREQPKTKICEQLISQICTKRTVPALA